MFPELEDQKVIEMEADDGSTNDRCIRVTRVGQISEDDSSVWIIRVKFSPSQDAVYEGRCIPTKDQLYVRAASTIDLILTPKTKLPL